MEEEKKSTNSDDAKLPWTLVACAYSVLVALAIDKLPVKQSLELLNDIIAEAKTVDVAMSLYRQPRDLYGIIMHRINRVIMDRLVKYNEDTATADEHDEVLLLEYVRNALDDVDINEFEYMLTTIRSNNGASMQNKIKIREYQFALMVVAPDKANAIIADIERDSFYLGGQCIGMGAPMVQAPGMYATPPQVNRFGQPNMYNNLYRNGNPFQNGPARPFTPNNGSGFGDMNDVLGGDNGKKK